LEQLVKNDAILASSLIKRYFRSLEDPLLVGALYHTIIAAATSTEESESDTSREMVKTILQKRLPPQNYNMLKIICEFLKNKIVTKSGANFMTPENLAIVFQPNILYLVCRESIFTDNVARTKFDGFVQRNTYSVSHY
jgi:hypothetical protein